VVIGDMNMTTSADITAPTTTANVRHKKRWCRDDGFNVTGGEGGSWTTSKQRSQSSAVLADEVLLDAWEPDGCRYEPVTPEEFRTFVGNVSIFLWGDSVQHRYFSALDGYKSSVSGEVSAVSTLTFMNKATNGGGLGDLFQDPKKLILGPNWKKLHSSMLNADLIVLNSGLHDLSPEWFDDRKRGNGYWGDKARVFAQYEERLETVFKGIVAASDALGGDMPLLHRVIWRTTSYPNVFRKANEFKGNIGADTTRCDSQRLNAASVHRLNAIEKTLALRHGIAVIDVSALSLSAPHSHFDDAIHPAPVMVNTVLTVLFRHSVTDMVRRDNSKR
jgi:hypothetical protein